MSQCITQNPTSLDVVAVEEGAFYYYVVLTSTSPTIKVYFTPPRNGAASGSATVASVYPSGPTYAANWIEFTTSNSTLDQEYTVQVTYTNPPSDDGRVVQLEVPTKSPKFKPKTTCPTSAE